uniref:Uncharacterized protein n=1 Tax=Arundo donax TaxID=35708 RepID=A0A0A8YBK2_ARUDO
MQIGHYKKPTGSDFGVQVLTTKQLTSCNLVNKESGPMLLDI